MNQAASELASKVKETGSPRARAKPKTTLFRQNLMLFVALIVFGQMSASALFFHYAQRPRLEIFTSIAARQLVTTRHTLSALDGAGRRIMLDQINAGGALNISSVAPKEDAATSIGVAGLVLRLLRRQLDPEGIDIALLGEPSHRLVAHWRDSKAATDYYVTLPDIPLAAGSPAVWIFLSILIGLLSLGGALLAERHLNRPLHDLVASARAVGAGQTPARLSEDGPREIATVAQGFNKMVDDLVDIEQQRALMLAGVSHDLRTPLTKMRLVLGILENNIEPALLAQMIRGIEDMDRLLEQFLDFARVDSDETVIELDLVQLLHKSIEASGIDSTLMRVSVPQALSIEGRPVMLKRMLGNIFDNAAKYGAISAQHPLEVCLGRAGDDALFECLDHGAGFEPGDTQRLTRPFIRGADSSTPGAGLGLAIVARIVALHRGQLTLDGRVEGGGAVRIRLPLG